RVVRVGEGTMRNRVGIRKGWVKAMRIPILSGREFNEADQADSQKVTIIDEGLAREYWPGEEAVGKRIRFGPPEDNEPWHTIVGVVGSVQQERLDVTVRKTVYLPHSQMPMGSMSLAIRSTVAP